MHAPRTPSRLPSMALPCLSHSSDPSCILRQKFSASCVGWCSLHFVTQESAPSQIYRLGTLPSGNSEKRKLIFAPLTRWLVMNLSLKLNFNTEETCFASSSRRGNGANGFSYSSLYILFNCLLNSWGQVISWFRVSQVWEKSFDIFAIQ